MFLGLLHKRAYKKTIKDKKVNFFILKNIKRYFLFKSFDISKVNKIFNKYIDKKNIQLNQDIELIDKKIRYQAKKNFSDKNEDKYFFNPFKSVNMEAEYYGESLNLDWKDYVLFLFRNANSEELENVSNECLSNILNDFDLDIQIEISNIIKNKIKEKKDKENIIKNNLKEIESLKEIEKNKISNIINRV